MANQDDEELKKRMIEALIQAKQEDQKAKLVAAAYGTPVTSGITSNVVYTNIGNSSVGSVLGGPYLSGAGGGLTTGVQTTSNPNHMHIVSAVVPNPTGGKVNIIFTDANGFHMSLFVDAAYANIINQISMQHGQINYLQQPYQAPPHHKMVDGDFSLDEIVQAEEIMEDLRA